MKKRSKNKVLLIGGFIAGAIGYFLWTGRNMTPIDNTVSDNEVFRPEVFGTGTFGPTPKETIIGDGVVDRDVNRIIVA